jgi:hypothetical protein
VSLWVSPARLSPVASEQMHFGGLKEEAEPPQQDPSDDPCSDPKTKCSRSSQGMPGKGVSPKSVLEDSRTKEICSDSVGRPTAWLRDGTECDESGGVK